MIKVKTTFLLLVAHLASLVASQLEFINFPLNLTLPISQSFDLHWHGQDSYVNISLAQFYYFGGGSEVRDYITTFNNGSTITWTADRSLQQGIYAFFIVSPNRNSSETPFFALIAENSSTYPATSSVPGNVGLSDMAKVGIGIGVPLGLTIVSCLAFIFWREKTYRQSRAAAILSHGNVPQRTVAELESKRPIYELRADR